jgi:hypothetical protein
VAQLARVTARQRAAALTPRPLVTDKTMQLTLFLKSRDALSLRAFLLCDMNEMKCVKAYTLMTTVQWKKRLNYGVSTP